MDYMTRVFSLFLSSLICIKYFFIKEAITRLRVVTNEFANITLC